MTFDERRSQIRSAVWEGMIASGIDFSRMPDKQRNALADAITNQVLTSVNRIMEEAVPSALAADEEVIGEEKILWQGRPFLTLNESYVITSERIKVIRGLIGREVDNYELIRVQDINVTQAPGERMFGIGDITIHGADKTRPTLVLRNIQNPHEVYELLRKAWLKARKDFGLMFREEM